MLEEAQPGHLIIYVNPTASYSRVQSITQQADAAMHVQFQPLPCLTVPPLNNFGSTRDLTMNKFIVMKDCQFLVYTVPHG